MNVESPDPNWLPFVKLLFGFLLLIEVGALAAAIALGKVEAQTSHGLDIILGSLTTLSGGFAAWAFTEGRAKPDQSGKNQ